jgi:hypothetical protein
MDSYDLFNAKTDRGQSKGCSILGKGRAFFKMLIGAGKKPYVNPFDAVAKTQAQQRQESEGYSFFVKAGFATIEEMINIFGWLEADGDTRDKEGKIRIMILRKLPDSVLQEIVDPEKPHYQPSSLRYEIQKRMRLK